MSTSPPDVTQDEERLGRLAMNSQTVERLIHSGRWHAMPPLEDQLPDDWMPPAFFEYWSRQDGAP
jgi:hypothetical protein